MRTALPTLRIRLGFPARLLLGILFLGSGMFWQQHRVLMTHTDMTTTHSSTLSSSLTDGFSFHSTQTHANRRNGTVRTKVKDEPKNSSNSKYFVVGNHTCSVNGKRLSFPTVPQFIIAGAQKSGTTALFEFLNEHPDIQGSLTPEAHFFDWYYPSDDISRHEWLAAKSLPDPLPADDLLCAIQKAYSENFNVTLPDKLYFEKSPSYLFLTKIPSAIASTCFWKPKIVVILRNPIDRAIAHYRMHVRTYGRSFEDFVLEEVDHMRHIGLSTAPLPTHWNLDPNDPGFAIPALSSKAMSEDLHWKHYRKMFSNNYLQRGMYITQLEHWLPYFPLAKGAGDEDGGPEHEEGASLLVLNYEQFKLDPAPTFARLLRFVGAPPFVPAKGFGTVHNSHEYRGDQMLPETRRYLKALFRPYNQFLADKLGEDWRGVWD